MINSLYIKTALYAYYRYKKQYICADECCACDDLSDLVVDTGGYIFEIEIKISRSDMFQGEKKKSKHKLYADLPYNERTIKRVPNHYYLCVPTELLEDAKEWVDKINPKYGILEYVSGDRKWEDSIRVCKRAKFLHEEKISPYKQDRITRRLCSARAITLMEKVNEFKANGKFMEDYQI